MKEVEKPPAAKDGNTEKQEEEKTDLHGEKTEKGSVPSGKSNKRGRHNNVTTPACQ